MRDDNIADNDRDSLHVLPLGMLPLRTPGLRRARLIKNIRLEGMVELFSDRSSGSGQVTPDQLHLVFDASPRTKMDVEIVRRLSALPSYDVYSLRVSLRNLGVEVDDNRNLRLSPGKETEVAAHLRDFTRPLVARIYGVETGAGASRSGLPRLFVEPDVSSAHGNLRKIAESLRIDINEIPKFLSDYADVFLSLSYYEHCRDTLAPELRKFRVAMRELRKDSRLRGEYRSLRQFDFVEQKLVGIYTEVGDVIDTFKARTENMWEDMTRARYREIENLVLQFQTRIGAGLCAAQVKVAGWTRRFPLLESGTAQDRACFITRDMVSGLDRIKSVARVAA
jgi:hypothetical protein